MFPDPIDKVFAFLKQKEAEGEFVFSTEFSSWDNDDILEPMHLGYLKHSYFKTVGLSFIIEHTDGSFVFPESENIWCWANALGYLAPISGWSPKRMANVVNSFPESDDSLDGMLNNAVALYCKAYYDKGLEILPLLPERRIGVLAGLMEGDFSRYCEEFHPQENKDEFTKAFLFTNLIEKSEVNEVYDIAISFDNFNSCEALQLFLKARSYLNEPKKTECEEHCKDILKQGNTYPYVSSVCNWAYRLKDKSSFVKDCIISLIEGLDKEHKGLLSTIDETVSFVYDGDIDFFQQVALCIAERINPLEVIRLEHTLQSFYKNEDAFVNFVLCFILNPKGLYRLAGRRIWDNFHLESSSFDVLSLTEELQCAFIVFMLRDFGNPETRLPKILPLFYSTSRLVRATLIQEIRPYTDEYMGHVSKAIEDAGIDTELTRSIIKYVEDRHKSIEKRRLLKELSPNYAQYEFYQEAEKTHRTKVSQHIAEVEKEKPRGTFLDSVKPQVLARGGGWRKDDGTTQHLIPVEVSIPDRLMEQSMMPCDRAQWLLDLVKDYD